MIFTLKETRQQYEICLLICALCSYLFRFTFPILKIPSFFLLFICTIHFLYSHRKSIFDRAKDFLLDFYLPLALFGVLVLSFLFSNKWYVEVFKLIVNGGTMLLYLFFMKLAFSNPRSIKSFLKLFVKILFWYALGVAVIGIANYLHLLINSQAFKFLGSTLAPTGISLVEDYNFYSLMLLLGIVSSVVLAKDTQGLPRLFYSFGGILLYVGVLFCGSRRGILALSLVTIAMVIVPLLHLFWKNIIHPNYFKPSLIFLTGIFVIFLLILAWYQIPWKNKNAILDGIGVDNLWVAKQRVTNTFYRYSFKGSSEIAKRKKFHDRLWSHQYDPIDPSSGWGTRRHERIFPLNGLADSRLPENTVGYLLDSTSDASTWRGHAYSYTKIGSGQINDGDCIMASVFCFVSEDFNGNWVRLILEGSNPAKIDYDLDRKGTWQFLSVKQPAKKAGKADALMYFSKHQSIDFADLKGYVIFAYPLFGLNDLPKQEKARATPKKKAAHTESIYLETRIGEPKESVWNIAVSEASLIKKTPSLLKAADASNSIIKLKYYLKEHIDAIIVEDSTYFPLKNEVLPLDLTLSHPDSRLLRIKFSILVFVKEFSPLQKMFGAGFANLNWFGYHFYGDKRRTDWAHNPFCSILLYSGIMGVLIYCFFLYKSTRLYLKFFKLSNAYLIMLGMSFIFAFFSSTTPFDPPIVCFLSLIPFLINNIYRAKTNKKYKEIA